MQSEIIDVDVCLCVFASTKDDNQPNGRDMMTQQWRAGGFVAGEAQKPEVITSFRSLVV